MFLPRHATAFQDPGKRLKIGVALQGGGAKGLAHIGVLQWFEDNHIPIDYIAGTSMGGLIGGLYATGNSPAEIERMVKAINWGEVMSGSIPYQDLAFRRKEDLRAFPNGLELGLRNGVESPGGLNSGQRVRLIIDRSVLAYSNVHNFDNLPIPFRCVGTDLVSGKRVVFHDGSLPEALRATMSIPAVFAPIKGENGGVYADGGLLDNLPTDVVKQMGADIVIGVHLTTGPVSPSNVRSMFQVAGASTDVMISANEVRGMEQADILITVNLAGYTTLDFSRVQEIIAKGTEAAVPRSAVLAPYRLSDSDWKAHLAERDSRRVKTVPVPQFVEVRGTDPHVASDLEENLSPFVDKPIETPELERHIIRAAGLGRFNTVSYGLTTRNEKPGLLINAEEKEYSPPWLKPGFVIDGSDPNNVQFALGARITFLDLGGYRSELRTDFSFGSTYLIGTEYYHPFTPTTRWFIAPAVQASRSPLNLYVRGTFLAEYKLNDVLGSFDLGYAIDRFSELRFGYQAGYSKSSRWSGSPLLPSVSGRTGLSRVRYVVDRLDNPIIPRTGFSVALNGGWVDANPGAKTGFPSGELSFQAFHRLSDPGSLYLVGAGGSTFGYNRVGIPQFSLGSPARLAAYGINEYLTNQYVYGRLGYLHRVGELPAILGSGWYLDGHVEAAKPYGPARVSNVPGDFAGGIIMQTILGPVLVGASIGESGHHKWFFQLGRVF